MPVDPGGDAVGHEPGPDLGRGGLRLGQEGDGAEGGSAGLAQCAAMCCEPRVREHTHTGYGSVAAGGGTKTAGDSRMRVKEIWGDLGRFGEIWGDLGRSGEIWGDLSSHLLSASWYDLRVLMPCTKRARLDHQYSSSSLGSISARSRLDLGSISRLDQYSSSAEREATDSVQRVRSMM